MAEIHALLQAVLLTNDRMMHVPVHIWAGAENMFKFVNLQASWRDPPDDAIHLRALMMLYKQMREVRFSHAKAHDCNPWNGLCD